MLKQQGYDLMGAAFEVYNELGYGMAEEVYQQSLESNFRCEVFLSSRKQN